MEPRQFFRTVHSLVLNDRIVPFERVKIFASRAQDRVVELAAVAIFVGVGRGNEPIATGRKVFVGMQLFTPVGQTELEHVKSGCGNVKMRPGGAQWIAVGTKIGALEDQGR